MAVERDSTGCHARRFLLAACATVCACLSPALAAHHSSAIYDRDTAVELTGKTIAWEWTNPHCWLQVDVLTATGPMTYNVESAAINLLIRRGWTPASLKPGDDIVFRYHPLRNGEPGGELVSVTKADGTRLVVQAPGAQ